ncbi:S8 family serine peptidase [Aminivibrio sp.]|uniref:S8 family serine peptidase n=1 Tax=Aminivibrio sp. TaxID=1872489 RepID=UPI001A43E270|nr:S8 family serine peptidase [Aminivibrio sp.]MBL3540612.1 S8 family serine peptidase [Aminivibrio sp.]
MKRVGSIVALVVLLGLAATAGASQIPGGNDYPEGEVLVLLKVPVSAESVSAAAFRQALSASATNVAASAGAQAVSSTPTIAEVTGKDIVLLRSGEKTTEELLQALEGNPAVLAASPNYRVYAAQTPNDPGYSNLWGMSAIRAPAAWDRSTGSRGVYAAVLDTGIDYNHDDLADNMGRDLNGHLGKDILNNDDDPMDDNGHGTHVAGIIGAVGNNGIGVAGVNWEVSLLAVKVLDDEGLGDIYNLVSGLEYVTDQKRRGLNIRVANMSLGVWLNRSISNDAAAINAMNTACEAVSNRGVILAVASGNEYQDISNPGGILSNPDDLLADYRDKLPYPASFRHSNMITVTAINSSYRRPDFANYSSRYVHLAAPGVGIWSTYHNGEYKEMNGTSMATPYVAGAAALLSAMFPSESAGQIRSRILGNVKRTNNLSDIVSTEGYLDIQAAVANETPSSGGGGGCNTAGEAVPAVALLLFPLGLLMKRKK